VKPNEKEDTTTKRNRKNPKGKWAGRNFNEGVGEGKENPLWMQKKNNTRSGGKKTSRNMEGLTKKKRQRANNRKVNRAGGEPKKKKIGRERT